MASNGAIRILPRGPLDTGCDDNAEGKLGWLLLFNLLTHGMLGSNGF